MYLCVNFRDLKKKKLKKAKTILKPPTNSIHTNKTKMKKQEKIKRMGRQEELWWDLNTCLFLWVERYLNTSRSPKKWNLHLWRYLKANRSWFWTVCCSRSCLEQGIGQDYLPKAPPISATLWFWYKCLGAEGPLQQIEWFSELSEKITIISLWIQCRFLI